LFILHLLELVDGQQINMDTILDIKVHLRWDLYLDFRTATPLTSYCQLSFIVRYNLFYVPLHWKKENANQCRHSVLTPLAKVSNSCNFKMINAFMQLFNKQLFLDSLTSSLVGPLKKRD